MHFFDKSVSLILLIVVENIAGFRIPMLKKGYTQKFALSKQGKTFSKLRGVLLNSSSNSPGDGEGNIAVTNTINERLMSELQQATDKEKGTRVGVYEKFGLTGDRSPKTEEERRKGIEEARNLNGINPVVAVGGGIVTLIIASGLWFATNKIGSYFLLNPMDSDIYFIQRVTSVFRNLVMGIASLASGFFGVTGLGILALGIRVSYGVAVGELDPTPIKKARTGEEFELPNVWDLMTKPSRRRGGKNRNSFF